MEMYGDLFNFMEVFKKRYFESLTEPKFDLTNRMRFSVVCTVIDNDMGHHSGQNEPQYQRQKNVFFF